MIGIFSSLGRGKVVIRVDWGFGDVNLGMVWWRIQGFFVIRGKFGSLLRV
jgi:hypothetical protein